MRLFNYLKGQKTAHAGPASDEQIAPPVAAPADQLLRPDAGTQKTPGNVNASLSNERGSRAAMSDHNLKQAALDYHEADPPGKISISATKPMVNQTDLALAYSPGVAHACTAIAEDPSAVSRYTARANLVAVITNGTAVLGLGDIGPLASKPVMEGKAVLFKKFAGIDVFDIEVDEKNIEPFVEAVARLDRSPP